MSDLWLGVVVWLTGLAGGVIWWVGGRKYFAELADGGYSVFRVGFSLLVAGVVWTGGILKILPNSDMGVFAVMGVLGLGVALCGRRGGQKRVIKEQIVWVITEEVMGAMAMGWILFSRGFAPEINSLEKYMDWGMVNRYLTSEVLPAIDMWQGGKMINYYSFGHFWASVVARVFRNFGDGEVYNMLLAYFGGGAMVGGVGVLGNLSKGKILGRLWGAVIGGVLLCFGGNWHLVYYFMTKGSLDGYWYADATRFIDKTIHEFPGYSFVVSDLHAHVIGLGVCLIFISLLFGFFETTKKRYAASAGFLLGVMMMSNTWDVAIYGLLSLVLGGVMVVQGRAAASIRGAFLGLCVMMATGGLWLISFDAIQQGVGLVQTRSELHKLLALWSGGGLVVVLCLIFARKNIFMMAMAVTALLLIAIPEFVFVRDIYTDYPRANTMFKLTYQAFVLLVICAGLLWGDLVNQKLKNGKIWIGMVMITMIGASSLAYPFVAFPSYFGDYKQYLGLDGMKWIGTKYPGYQSVIEYLSSKNEIENIVEAVGESYTDYNLVSVFSGKPTIQGWRVHEWLWRGGFGVVSLREAEVAEIYEGSDREKTKELLKRYKIGAIVVGVFENEKYRVNEEKLEEMGDVIRFDQSTYLIELR